MKNPSLSSTREQPQDWEYYQSDSSPSFHPPRNQEDPRYVARLQSLAKSMISLAKNGPKIRSRRPRGITYAYVCLNDCSR